MNVQSNWLPRVGALVILSLSACSRPLSQAEIATHFREGSGSPDYLFAPGGHINFDANVANLIRDWLAAHGSDWRAASLSDFSPAKTQMLTAGSGIEIDGDRIVVTFERTKKDYDSTVYLQRPLSQSEQSFWSSVVNQIKSNGKYEARVNR